LAFAFASALVADTNGMEGAAAGAKGSVYGAETTAGKRARKFVTS